MNKYFNDGYHLYLWAIPFTLYLVFQLFDSDPYTSGPIILKALGVFILAMGANAVVGMLGFKQNILDDVIPDTSPEIRLFKQGLIFHIIIGVLVLGLTFAPIA